MEPNTAQCASCGHHNPATNRFCGSCGAQLPLTCPSCGALNGAGNRFCGACGTALETAPEPFSSVPRPHILDETGEERRLVTVLFCDLAGFTSLAEHLDPEDVREFQASYFSAMSEEIKRFDGTVEKYAGDAVLALFGVPTVHEDDPERSVLCGLALQAAIRPLATVLRSRYGTEVSMRVGINTGEAISGSWSASGWQDVAVTGDVINVAARLQAAAEGGAVVVGDTTMRLTRRRIEYGDRLLLPLKGKSEPVTAYRALRAKDLGERWETSAHPVALVGRHSEIQAMMGAWRRMQEGEGQLLTVVGEPGVGKSRLISEALEQLTAEGGIRILRGRCLSYGQHVSLWLISDLLRRLFDAREGDDLEAVREHARTFLAHLLEECDEEDRAIAHDVLGEVLGLPPSDSLVGQADPEIRRQSLLRSLRIVFAALSQEAPAVLVLEDLHWIDHASEEILREILADVPGLRLCVFAAQRSGWNAPWNDWGWTERITLRPLPEAEGATLAAAVLGGKNLSPGLLQYVRDRAAGNPFFVEELLGFLEEIGGIDERDGVAYLVERNARTLPSTLIEVLVARLDRLETEVKTVAQVASVIGRSFAVRLLARVMDKPQAVLDGPLRTLQSAEIAFPRSALDLEYVFKHVTFRDAAYGMLVHRRRRQLHAATAQAIVALYPSDEYVEMIAFHYARTDEDEAAAQWLERAGDRARAIFATEAAIEHYRQTIERLERLGGQLPRRSLLEEKLGEMLDVAARYSEAQDVLERAISGYRESGDMEGVGRATALLGLALRNQGRLEDARRHLKEVERQLQGAAPSVAAAHASIVLASTSQVLGRYGEMLEVAERALAAASATGDKGWMGWAAERHGTALILAGRIEDGRRGLERAIELLEGAGDLRALPAALGNLGENRRVAGELSEARRLHERALELAARTGHVKQEMFFHLTLGQILLTSGEWTRAGEHVLRAKEIEKSHGASAAVAPVVWQLAGELALRQGDWETAATALARSLDLAPTATHEVLEEVQCLVAEQELLEGRFSQASARLAPLIEREDANLPLLLPVFAWSQLQLGEPEAALRLAREASLRAAERQDTLHAPEAKWVEGMALHRLGLVRESLSVLFEAWEIAKPMPKPYSEGHILLEMGATLQSLGKNEEARIRLHDALAVFQRLGAVRDQDATQSRLQAL